jgi:rRNA-processing protein EBP2
MLQSRGGAGGAAAGQSAKKLKKRNKALMAAELERIRNKTTAARASASSAPHAQTAARTRQQHVDSDDESDDTLVTRDAAGESGAESDAEAAAEFALVAERMRKKFSTTPAATRSASAQPNVAKKRTTAVASAEVDADESDNEQDATESSEGANASTSSVALKSMLASLALPASSHWIESLAITYNSKGGDGENGASSGEIDAFDDLKREATFYHRSLAGAKIAVAQLHALGVPVERPNDYFAEMLKPDHHMARIREALLVEKRKIASVAERRRLREEKMIKAGRGAEKKREKTQNKLDRMDEAHKQRKRSQGGGEIKVERSAIPLIDEMLKQGKRKQHSDTTTPTADAAQHAADRPPTRGGDAKKRSRSADGRDGSKSKKRRMKDDKYGFGGRKRDQKRNSKSSAADMSGFSVGKNKRPFQGFDGKRKSSNKKK